MLQQTRVETVIPYYERFLAAYPTVSRLAEAPLEEVLARWSGLGYYRRARALHAAAQQVRDDFAGALPKTAEELRAVHGIGPYTAGAVASIAFGEAVPVVDGNVARVLARLFALDDDIGTSQGMARLWKLAATLVPAKRAGDFNQALMELGATVCTPKGARCLLCPARTECAAFATGRVEELPKKEARGAVKAWSRVALVAQKGEGILLARRKREGLFGGMWEPPMVDGGEDDVARLHEVVRGTWSTPAIAGAVTHVLSHRKMRITVATARLRGAVRLLTSEEYDAVEVVPWPSEGERGISTLAQKVVARAR